MKGINGMAQDPTIVFVCEHGAAKSIIAAAYFNKLASERHLVARAVARGTNPDEQLSTKTIEGLRWDGLEPTESAPRKLIAADVETAQRVISFCELPDYSDKAVVELWDDIPPVSENYERARDAILERLNKFMK